MTDNQRELLRKLADTLYDLAGECEMDYNFNDTIVDLDLFMKDLTEAGDEIYEKIGE